jgi:cytoskeletal protein CcmA (bactofilin family)
MSGEKSFFHKSGSKAESTSEEISAYLGKETVFEGKMTFEGVFRLDGKFEGEIFESGTLIIGETAVVKGKISVNTLIIDGLVEGEVSTKGRTEIHAKGKFYGSLMTPVLLINEGGIFDGKCKMDKTLDKEDEAHLPSQREPPLEA